MVGQIVLLYGGLNDFFSDISLDLISVFEKKLLYFVNESIIFTILNSTIRDEIIEDLLAFFINIIKVYLSNE